MKIAINTNVLIRLITNDMKILVLKAKALITQYGERDIFVSYGVMMELYFVLKYHYDFSEELALETIEDVLKIKQFNVEQSTAITLAIEKARNGCGFYDALIGEIASLKNIKTFTFDKNLKKNASFMILS